MTSTPPWAPLLDLLMGDTHVGRCLVAPDGTVLRVNEEWLRATGATRDVVGRDLAAALPELEALALRARDGQRVEVPRRAVPASGRDDGRGAGWEGRIEPVPLGGGTGLLVTARAAPPSDPPAARDEREAVKYRSLFEHSLDAVYLAREDGTILDANPAACRLHGMTVEEIRQVGRAGLVVTDERHAAALKARAERGRVRAEMTVRRKDGTFLEVEVESVLLEPGRADSAAFVISRDITHRRRAEREAAAALRRAEEERRRLSAVLEALPAGVALADATGKIVQFNAAIARIWGSPPVPQSADEYREWRGRWLDSGKPLEPGEWAMSRALFRGETVVPGDVVEIEKFDGSGTAIIVNAAAPIRAEDGTIVGGVLAEVDITEQKRAEAALREANERLRDADRRKDEFLGMLSHELRNPLAPIRNALYILDHAPPDGEQARRAKEVARRQITHITRLVDDLLDVTRIARGRIELRRADLDLGAVARRTADDYRSILGERGLALEVDVPGERVEVNGDETRLAQILGNLLSNAAKFTPGGGTVTLSVREEGDRAVVHVRDTGPGIAPEVLALIFEPFTQAKQSLARSEGGLGLGLALVKSLVELHGGEVRAASEGAGRGSDFTVTLPLARASRPSR